MKLLHLQQIDSSIPKLINTNLPIKYAYKLNLIMDDIQKYMSTLQKFQLDFFNEHGEQIDDGRFKIPEDKIEHFDKEIGELLNEDIDISPVPIPLSILLETDIQITVLEIESLKNAGFLIDDINSNED